MKLHAKNKDRVPKSDRHHLTMVVDSAVDVPAKFSIVETLPVGSQGCLAWDSQDALTNSMLTIIHGTSLRPQGFTHNHCRMSPKQVFVAFFQIVAVPGFVRPKVLHNPSREEKMTPLNDTDQEIASPGCTVTRLKS